jgi:hypothetical protein
MTDKFQSINSLNVKEEKLDFLSQISKIKA